MCTYVQCTCVHGCVYLHVCVCVDVMYVRTYVVQSHSSKHQKEMALLHAIRTYIHTYVGELGVHTYSSAVVRVFCSNQTRECSS